MMTKGGKNSTVPYQERTWYRKLVDKIKASEPHDDTTYFLALVEWKQPPRLSGEQNFQLCSILHSQLLTVGATPEDFEAALADPQFYEPVDFVHSFKAGDEEYPMRESLRIVKCSFIEKDALAGAVTRQQCIRLVLSTLGMFGIQVDRFVEIMHDGWETGGEENQQQCHV